jgi:mono/diheme cytochrome c family protein
MRIHNFNCVRCHGNHLPKMGAALYSERGLWLVQKKAELKAPRVDVSWLRDYVEKEKPKK